MLTQEITASKPNNSSDEKILYSKILKKSLNDDLEEEEIQNSEHLKKIKQSKKSANINSKNTKNANKKTLFSFKFQKGKKAN